MTAKDALLPLAPYPLSHRARPEAAVYRRCPGDLPTLVAAADGGASGRPLLKRGTDTGEAAEICAIRAKLRYGEQSKGSAGEFRQARTNLNQSQDPFGPSPQPSSVQS